MQNHEQAALEVLIGGRYGGMSGMQGFQNDLSRISQMLQKTFIEPWKSPSGAIKEYYDKAAVAAEKASMAQRDAALSRQKYLQGNVQLDAQHMQSLEREKKAYNDIEKAQLSVTRAKEAERRATQAALTAPRGSHTTQYNATTAREQRRIAEQDLANAQTSAKAWTLQRQAAEANLPIQSQVLEQTARRRQQYANQMEEASLKEQKAAKQFERNMRIQSGFGRVNSVANTGIIGGGAIVGGAVYVGMKAANWRTSIASVGANTNMSGNEQDWLAKHGLVLMQQMPANQQQILQGYRFAKQAGFSYGNALQLDRQVLKSALPTGADPGMLMFTLTALLKQFGYEGKAAVAHSRPMMDYIHTAAATGNMNIEQFANNFGQIGAFASRAQSPEIMLQAMALFSAMTQMHIPYAQASTQSRGFLQQVMMPRPKAADLLQTLFYQSGGKINLLKDFSAQGLRDRGIGGVLADVHSAHLTDKEMQTLFPNMRGILSAFLGSSPEGLKTFGRINSQIHNAPFMFGSKGATQGEYNEWIKQAGPQFKQLHSNLMALEITMGQGVLPLMVKFSGAMIPVVQNITKWAQGHKGLVEGIVKFGAALLGVSLAVRGLSAVFSPFTRLVFSTMDNWDKITKLAGGMGGALTKLMGLGPRLMTFFITMGEGMYAMLGPWGIAIGLAVALGVGLAVLYNKWAPFHNLVNGTAEALKNFATVGMKAVGNFFSWLGSTVKTAGTKALDWLKNNWKTALFLAVTWPFTGPLFLFFKLLPQSWLTYAENAAGSFVTGIKNKAGDLVTAAKNFLGGALGWLKFQSPNAYGVDFEMFGGNAGKSWVKGLDGQRPSAQQHAGKWVDSVTQSLSGKDSQAKMYQAGQSLGEQVGNGVQSKLNGMSFIANVNLNGAGPNVSIPSVSYRTTGGYTSVPGWKAGTQNAPGKYYSPGLHQTLNTPFGNFGGASSNRVDNSDASMLNSWGITPSGTVMDTDYPSGAPGTKHNVVLPGGPNAKWKLLKSGVDKNTGGYEVWQSPNGGTMTFLHLSKEQVLGPHPVTYGKSGRMETSWYTPQVGQSVSGGTVVGLSGHPLTGAYGNDPNFWHLCVVTDAKGRQYIAYLTTGQMQQMQKSGAKVTKVSSPNTWFGKESQASSLYMSAATAQHIDPALLAAIGMVESSGDPNNMGVMGVPRTAGQQIPASARSLRGNINWAAQQKALIAKYKTKIDWILGQAGMETTTNNEAMVLGLAAYNAGPGGAHLMQFAPAGANPDGYGLSYALSALKLSTKANHGNSIAMWWTGKGPTAYSAGSDPSAPGGPSGALPNTGNGQLGKPNVNWSPNQYGAYPNEVGPDGMPITPGKNGMTKARYFYLMGNMHQQQFKAAFPDPNSWKWLNKSGLKTYEWMQWRVWHDQEQAQVGQVNNWWSHLSPAQRADPGYQAAYQVQLGQAKQTFQQRMNSMQTNVATQPLQQRAFWMHSNYQNLHDEFGLVQHPWTLSKKDQKSWLQGEKSMDWYWAQYEAANARIYAKQHKGQQGIGKWLADKLHAIWAEQSQKDANALYKLTHHGAQSTGSDGRVTPVRVIGHCAEEAAANVHRKKSGDGAQKSALSLGKIEEHGGKTVTKLDDIHHKLDELLKALHGLGGPSMKIGQPISPGTHDPRFRGRQHKPSSI